QPAVWLDSGECLERELVPALLDMGVLDSHPVSPRGPILLASADDQLRGAGIPLSPRGTSLADGDGADPEYLASAPRHANQLAAVGSRGGVPAARLVRSGRS